MMNRSRQVILVAAVIALAGVAHAEPEASRPGFDRPLGGKITLAPAQSALMSETRIRSIEGDQTYEIHIQGDVVTASINGKTLTDDRVRRGPDKVEILDANGKVLKSFDVVVSPKMSARSTWGRSIRVPQPPVAMAQLTPPPVMIGITMTEVPESLAEHLGIDAEKSVMIDRAIEGLPAAKAGLLAKDIVVSFDGKEGLNEEGIRDILRTKAPGDKVEVVVLRKGERKTVTLELAKFDGAKVGGRVNDEAIEMPEIPEFNEDMLREIPDLELRDMLRGRMGGRMGGQPGDRNTFLFRPGNGEWQALGGAQSAELKAQADELKSNMAAMKKQLAELRAQLEELKALNAQTLEAAKDAAKKSPR